MNYTSFGLNISSDILLNELMEGESNSDVCIRFEKFKSEKPAEAQGGKYFWVMNNTICRSYRGVGSFLIKDGQEILINSLPGTDERIIRVYLLGNILGLILVQRGFLALHGSAISVDNSSVAFLGRSGCGKSTMAAALSKDYSLVTDDIVAIDVKEKPFVYPGFPQLKLWPDAVASLGYNANELPKISPDEEKRAARLKDHFSRKPLPLEKIYILEEGETISVEQFGKKDALLELVRNTYPILALTSGVNISQHFLQCTRVVMDVPICRLTRPRDFSRLPDVVRFVRNDLKQDN